MTEDYCRCPGCGTCAASKNEKKLKMKLRRLDANEAALLEALKDLAHLDYGGEAVALITRIEAERNEK